MTEEQKSLIRDSFARLAPDAEAVAASFYGRLFAADPALRTLFKGDMAAQGRKLMTMIGTAVANLSQLDAVVPAVRELGARHRGYGVADKDYATVGGALLDTLAAGLGPDFTPAMRDAWAACYTTLAGVMKEAAQEEAAAG
jgi:hemoglobin-like flavoprotein